MDRGQGRRGRALAPGHQQLHRHSAQRCRSAVPGERCSTRPGVGRAWPGLDRNQRCGNRHPGACDRQDRTPAARCRQSRLAGQRPDPDPDIRSLRDPLGWHRRGARPVAPRRAAGASRDSLRCAPVAAATTSLHTYPPRERQCRLSERQRSLTGHRGSRRLSVGGHVRWRAQSPGPERPGRGELPSQPA